MAAALRMSPPAHAAELPTAHAAAPRRRSRLARSAAVIGAAAALTSGLLAASTPAAAASQVPLYNLDQQVSYWASWFTGRPYSYGGENWSAGFDCSGLAQYLYAGAYHFSGYSIPRTADEQFLYFRQIPESEAWGGDLVFFHVSSDPESYVYHVGIYEGGGNMISALNPQYGVAWTPISWGGPYYTFGTISH
ncbi:MAG: C40 family peptidase [Streptosporangiaceae bacterium]|nr:C40 family peptidase [Streptosporangiaceae bacterium]